MPPALSAIGCKVGADLYNHSGLDPHILGWAASPVEWQFLWPRVWADRDCHGRGYIGCRLVGQLGRAPDDAQPAGLGVVAAKDQAARPVEVAGDAADDRLGCRAGLQFPLGPPEVSCTVAVRAWLRPCATRCPRAPIGTC